MSGENGREDSGLAFIKNELAQVKAQRDAAEAKAQKCEKELAEAKAQLQDQEKLSDTKPAEEKKNPKHESPDAILEKVSQLLRNATETWGTEKMVPQVSKILDICHSWLKANHIEEARPQTGILARIGFHRQASAGTTSAPPSLGSGPKGAVELVVADQTPSAILLQQEISTSTGMPPLLELCNLVQEREGGPLLNGGLQALAQRLGTNLEGGLPADVPDFEQRVNQYGKNAFAHKELTSYFSFLWEALQDKIILMLLTMATAELIIKYTIGDEEERKTGYIDPMMIYLSVAIIINLQSALDYQRERQFEALSEMLDSSNLRFVVRGGRTMNLSDEQIVVGDIISFNSHMAAVIPCDCLLVEGDGVKTDEAALTGEPEPQEKDAAHPFMISGTTVNAGQGKMMVIAVGENSVSGKIRKAVYNDEADEKSPLFLKLDTMAGQIGQMGMLVALVVFIVQCVYGFVIKEPKEEIEALADYIIQALGILAVAIPEGLPLALTISLAFSSNKMTKESNLVKTLDSCETMGSATTICTDKTGTLTANRMTVKAAYIGGKIFPSDEVAVGKRIADDPDIKSACSDLAIKLIAVCTMDESQVRPPAVSGGEHQFEGNPTECACLKFAQDLGGNYEQIRATTLGRSDSTRSQGRANALSSARKIMSWAVPYGNGKCIVYVKGASEIILSRVVQSTNGAGQTQDMSDSERTKVGEVIASFASRAMRTIGLAFRIMDTVPGDEKHATVLNADGTPALACETGLTLLSIVGIEDPLRPEILPAINKCYTAGIDVRMVTGDNLTTAIAIARGAGILLPNHFGADGEIKRFRAIEGAVFRKHVHTHDSMGNAHFSQEKFDEVWPFLRVMARASPDDKLTLAKGLQSSRIFEDTKRCETLKAEEGITVFPDRQVVAMTGDGTNDAPALKAASVGFAMGIAGTQIAKDAANIILLDDNFASIVTAANWGRNVYDSIQKFLQFQLTVNIAICSIMLIATFGSLEAPLSITQLLWLNLIMDSLGALALASEPPTEAQLQRPPVNRSTSIVTTQMAWNMWGQALYQIAAISTIMFKPQWIPDCQDAYVNQVIGADYCGEGPNSKHYTVIFNAFVLMQLFNEYNSRFLQGECKIWAGLTQNPLFLATSFGTFAIQIAMAQFAGNFMKLHNDGLTLNQWLLCLGLGVAPLIWQCLINALVKLEAYLFHVHEIHAHAMVSARHQNRSKKAAVRRNSIIH